MHFCDLSYARTADDIVTRVLQDLELVLIEGVAGDALALALSQRQNMLVVIDNVEQVAQPMKALLARWTAIAPQVTFLLTSRVRIGLKNEVLHRLDALPLTDAMSLFMARAQQAAPLATLDAELLQAYASLIAQKVDRLPLAIELAAARIRTHSLQDIHDQLDDRFSLLYDRDGQRPERQSSLYAAIEWSWDLLERATQETFLQLAVFKTSFTLTAARAVVGFDGDEAGAMGLPGHLSVLVEHSLVRKLGIVEGESRYGFLESIRHFAETKQNDKWPAARSRHLAYFAQRGTSDSLRALDFAGGHELVRRWRHDLDNYSAAASYGLSQGLYDDAASVALVYLTTCKFMHLPAVGLALLDDDITSLCSGDLRLKLGLLEAELSILMGDAARCHERLKAIMAEPLPADQEVLSLKAEFLALQQNVDQLEFGVRRERLLALEARAREIDAIVIECDARLFRAWNQTDMDQMLGECRAVEARCQAHRLEWLEVSCKNYIGMTLYRLGRYEEAAQTLQNVALTSQEYGMERWEIGAIGNLGSVFKEQGRYQDAQANYLKTLSLAEQYGSPRLTAVFLTNLSELARVRHDLRAARTYGVRAVQLATKLELAYLVAITTGNLGYVLALDGDVDEGVVKLQGAIEKMRMLAPHYAAVYEARLAHICASQNRMDDADTLLLKALECVDTASLNIETAEICLHFMHVSSAGGRWREFNGMRQCLASYFESRGSPSSGPLYEAYLVATRSFATHAGSDP